MLSPTSGLDPGAEAEPEEEPEGDSPGPGILETRVDGKLPWFARVEKVVRLAGNRPPEVFHTIRPPDYVTVLALTRDGRIPLVRQYRPTVDQYVHGFPSGHVDPGETPDTAAVRELEEETRCRAKDVQLMGKLAPDVGRLENRLWAYYAPDVEMPEETGPTENGLITVHPVTSEELFGMIREGTFFHALDLSVVTLATLYGHLQP